MMKLLLALLFATQTSAFAPATLASGSQASTSSLFAQEVETSRRSWLVQSSAAAALATGVLRPDAALAADFQTYQNPVCGFQIDIPASWEKSIGQLPDRRSITYFIDPTGDPESKTLFFLAKTPVRDDFTSLGSFGSVERVAESVILPRGELVGGEPIPSELISSESKKNAYFFDYKVTPPGQPETHYRAIFSLAQGATGGAGAVLVTLTIQTPESRYAELKPVIDKMVDSYGKYVEAK